MKHLRDLSIRSKLTGIIVLISLFCLAAGFAFVIINDLKTFKQDMVANTVLIARVVGDQSVGDLAFGDRSESEKTLAHLKAIANIQYAFLYDARGELFSAYSASGSVDFRPPAPGSKAVFREGALHVWQPISYKNEKYGTLYVCASTRALDDKIRSYLATMLGVMVVLVALSVAFAVRLQQVISGPILNLASVTRRISEAHDYSIRVVKTGGDEVGSLCDAFNDMLSQIHNRELERDRADRRTREKSAFLANMSHELRTPLNSIIGFSEILLERLAGKASAKEQKFLENIHTSGQHLLGIINDILDLSKVEAGRMEIQPGIVSVRAVAEGVCQVMKGVSSKKRVTLSVECPPDLPTLEADSVKFKQILYNLLSNAVKFSPEAGTVRIRASHVSAAESPLAEDSVQVAVSDEGPGIDPKDHEIIFQEFRQAEGTAALQVEGTGLGLALVKKFVELHAGTISLESEPGRGTTFTITLPRQLRGRAAPAAPAAARPESASDPRKAVLVVEDDAAAYEPIRRELAAAGYLAVWARSAEEAIRAARSVRPVAVTLDLVLPTSSGWEILRSLKADPETRGIPVVIVSLLDNRELGMALGADDYFLKPVDEEQLVRRLREILPGGGPEGPRVLVIDDDARVHEMLAARLAPLGFLLDHARSGREGLERAVSQTPALIILDLLMEDMDGFEVAVRLASDVRTAAVPIVVLTAKDLTPGDHRRLRGKMAAIVRKGESVGRRLVPLVQSLVARHARAAGASRR